MEKNIDILNEYMANLKVFNNNLCNMYLNVIGPSFIGINKKLEEYSKKINKMYNNIAYRIKMFNGYPITSLKKIEDTSSIKSMKSQDYSGLQVMEVLNNDLNFLKEYTKDLISYFNKENDYYTSKILNDNLKFFEEELWIIENNLK